VPLWRKWVRKRRRARSSPPKITAGRCFPRKVCFIIATSNHTALMSSSTCVVRAYQWRFSCLITLVPPCQLSEVLSFLHQRFEPSVLHIQSFTTCHVKQRPLAAKNLKEPPPQRLPNFFLSLQPLTAPSVGLPNPFFPFFLILFDLATSPP